MVSPGLWQCPIPLGSEKSKITNQPGKGVHRRFSLPVKFFSRQPHGLGLGFLL